MPQRQRAPQQLPREYGSTILPHPAIRVVACDQQRLVTRLQSGGASAPRAERRTAAVRGAGIGNENAWDFAPLEPERKVHILEIRAERFIQQAGVDECLPPNQKSGERRQPGPLRHLQRGNRKTGTGTPGAGGAGKQVISAVEHAGVIVPRDRTAGVFGVRGVRGGERAGDPIRCQRDVTVDDGDPFRAGVENAGVHGVCKSLIAAECQDPGAEAHRKLRAVVGRAVIDDQDFARRQRLIQRRTYAFPEQMRSIEIRDDYDNWRGHTRPQQASGMVARTFRRGQSSERAAMMGL